MPAVAASPLGLAHLSCRGPSDRSRHLLCLKSRRKRLRRGCEGQEGVTRVLLGTREHGCSPQGGRGEAAVSPARFPRLLFGERPLGRHPARPLWPVAGTGETCRKPAGRWASPPLAPHNRPINWLPTSFFVQMFCYKLAASPGRAPAGAQRAGFPGTSPLF